MYLKESMCDLSLTREVVYLLLRSRNLSLILCTIDLTDYSFLPNSLVSMLKYFKMSSTDILNYFMLI